MNFYFNLYLLKKKNDLGDKLLTKIDYIKKTNFYIFISRVILNHFDWLPKNRVLYNSVFLIKKKKILFIVAIFILSVHPSLITFPRPDVRTSNFLQSIP